MQQIYVLIRRVISDCIEANLNWINDTVLLRLIIPSFHDFELWISSFEVLLDRAEIIIKFRLKRTHPCWSKNMMQRIMCSLFIRKSKRTVLFTEFFSQRYVKKNVKILVKICNRIGHYSFEYIPYLVIQKSRRCQVRKKRDNADPDITTK